MSNKSLKQQAYEWLKDKIIKLEFPMGSSISEAEISRELGIGRTPVREAIQQLAAEKLVVVLPRKGIFVSSLNFADFENIFEVRMMMELHVVRRLAGELKLIRKVPPERLKEIRQLFDHVEELVLAGDIDAIMTIERKFHQGLVELLGNPTMNNVARQVYDMVLRTMYLSSRNRSPENLIQTTHENLEILDAIVACDLTLAEKVLTKHLSSFRDNVFHQPQVY